MKFDEVYNDAMNQFDEIDDSVFFFLDEHADDVEQFKKIMNAELAKVKKADRRLAKIKLSFEDVIAEDEHGMILTQFDPVFSKTEIAINMTPIAYAVVNDHKIVEEAAKTYIYLGHEHVLQHECAHVLDYLENGDRENNYNYEAMHDDTFQKYEDMLNRKTHLNKSISDNEDLKLLKESINREIF